MGLGAVTTGPVTVPLVLSLGIGVASAVGSGESTLSGFGIVTLASLFPIMASMLLGVYIYYGVDYTALQAVRSHTAGLVRCFAWCGRCVSGKSHFAFGFIFNDRNEMGPSRKG